MYLVKTPHFIQNLFPNFTWKIPTKEKIIYLTFDDGPIPEVTPWVLSQLQKYDAKATFFCVGNNIEKHPEIFQQLKEEGHSVGNHTFNHLDGWVSENINYFHNVRRSAKITDTVLFRPPYGKLKPKQVLFLQRHYRIVMWDVLSGDFDQTIDEKRCCSNVINNVEPGSIVVFHDSLKAEKNLRYTLPRVLKHFHELGFQFENLNEHELVNNNLLDRKIA